MKELLSIIKTESVRRMLEVYIDGEYRVFLSKVIMNNISWMETIEGANFWSYVHLNLQIFEAKLDIPVNDIEFSIKLYDKFNFSKYKKYMK